MIVASMETAHERVFTANSPLCVQHQCGAYRRHSAGADSDLKPAAIPIKDRQPFRFEAGHRSNQRPASFRH